MNELLLPLIAAIAGTVGGVSAARIIARSQDRKRDTPMISFDPISQVVKSLMIAAIAAKAAISSDPTLPSLIYPERPNLHRAGRRAQLKQIRGDFFRSLGEYAGRPATRTDAGEPAMMNRAARRARARQVQFV